MASKSWRPAGADVILMNMQYSPRTESMIASRPMSRTCVVARDREVPFFDRLAIMRHWSETGAFDLYAATKKHRQWRNASMIASDARLPLCIIDAAHLAPLKQRRNDEDNQTPPLFCFPQLAVAAHCCRRSRVFCVAHARTRFKPRRARAPAAAPTELTRLDRPLARTARKLAAGKPIKIVAIGSSSTAGAGASSPADVLSEPLAVELKQPSRSANHGAQPRHQRRGSPRHAGAARTRRVSRKSPISCSGRSAPIRCLRDHPLAPAGTLIEEGSTQHQADRRRRRS